MHAHSPRTLTPHTHSQTVVRFESVVWADDVHYMTFRNGFPDEAKLRPSMVAEVGAAAYCCMCHWASVREVEEVGRSSPHSQWR